MLHNKCVSNLKLSSKDMNSVESKQWILSRESLQVVNLNLAWLDLVLYSIASDVTHWLSSDLREKHKGRERMHMDGSEEVKGESAKCAYMQYFHCDMSFIIHPFKHLSENMNIKTI